MLVTHITVKNYGNNYLAISNICFCFMSMFTYCWLNRGGKYEVPVTKIASPRTVLVSTWGALNTAKNRQRQKHEVPSVHRIRSSKKFKPIGMNSKCRPTLHKSRPVITETLFYKEIYKLIIHLFLYCAYWDFQTFCMYLFKCGSILCDVLPGNNQEKARIFTNAEMVRTRDESVQPVTALSGRPGVCHRVARPLAKEAVLRSPAVACDLIGGRDIAATQ